MSLEPALALLIGLVVLGQAPRMLPIAGIAFVVAAGIGAERTGGRPRAEAVRTLRIDPGHPVHEG